MSNGWDEGDWGANPGDWGAIAGSGNRAVYEAEERARAAGISSETIAFAHEMLDERWELVMQLAEYYGTDADDLREWMKYHSNNPELPPMHFYSIHTLAEMQEFCFLYERLGWLGSERNSIIHIIIAAMRTPDYEIDIRHETLDYLHYCITYRPYREDFQQGLPNSVKELLSLGPYYLYEPDLARYCRGEPIIVDHRDRLEMLDSLGAEERVIHEAAVQLAQTNFYKYRSLIMHFVPLTYKCCCYRTPGSLYYYFMLLLQAPLESREHLTALIVAAGYKSLPVATEIVRMYQMYDDLPARLARTKVWWPDCHIDKTHRFEKLFLKLLEMPLDAQLTEPEIVSLALTDKTSDQSIDMCWYGGESEQISEVTCQRLGLPVGSY